MLSIEISTNVQALVEKLITVSPGEMITYAELSSAIGCNSMQRHRPALQRAIDIARRDYGVSFSNKRGTGYARMTTEQVPTLGHDARASIGRKATRAAKRICQSTSRANDIPDDTMRKINAELSVLGLIVMAAKDATAKPIDAHAVRPEPVAIIARRFVEALVG